MEAFWKYLKNTSFADKIADAKQYMELRRETAKLQREEIEASLDLMQSYNYYEEDKYPTCISYVKANTDKGAVRGSQLCKKFSCDVACDDAECPGQLAHQKYVKARQAAKGAKALRDNFWNLMLNGHVK